MIFVTLGTQDKPFKRLLEAIDREIISGTIKEKVIVQAGYTKYNSKNMTIYNLLDKEEFNKYIKECNLLITHGGVGSILSGLNNNKKVIASPRLAKYNEHINDHQKQIINHFAEEGYIIAYNEQENLGKIINNIRNFKPKKFVSNNSKMINIISNYIDNN